MSDEMADLPVPTTLDQAVARDWLRYSLGQGDVVSAAALEFIAEREGRAYTLVPQTVDPALLATPHSGGVIGTRSAREAFAEVLAGHSERDAACVVVEDALSRRRDSKPNMGGQLLTGFIGEAVIHWASLGAGVGDAIFTVNRGSGDYPTNAFVTSAPAEAMGLVDGADLHVGIGEVVVASLRAVITAAYDAETYIVWEPD